MSKYTLKLFLLINFIGISFSLGINNIEKIDDTYIIDVSSENLPEFLAKLEWYLRKVEKEFFTFFVKVGLLFLLILMLLKILLKINISIILVMFFIFSFKTLIAKYYDYQYGIRSANNAINNFHLAMETNKHFSYDTENSEPDEIYVGDEIRKYGLHAVFCEIPGTLPSKNAKSESYKHIIGGFCYLYSSQRRYIDKNDPSFAGDELAKKYKEIKYNDLNYF